MGDDGYRKIRYGLQIQMHLIQAVKEQQSEIEGLREGNEDLKRRMEQIEGMLMVQRTSN